MKKVEITHAEVIPFYNSQEILKETKLEGKGTIINFNVQTRINDRVSNSPLIFEKCSYFASSDDQISRIREVVKIGSVLDIKGSEERSSYTDKSTGAKKYSNSIRVREITPVQVSQTAVAEPDELPF